MNEWIAFCFCKTMYNALSGVKGVGGAGGRVPLPETSDREISGELPGKNRQGKKKKMEQKWGKFKNGEVENWKGKEEKLLFFVFLFVLFFVFVFVFVWFYFLFTYVSCFIFYFLNFIYLFIFLFFLFSYLILFFFFCFVLGLPKWESSTGKKHSHREKNQEKWLCPPEKYSSYAPECTYGLALFLQSITFTLRFLPYVGRVMEVTKLTTGKSPNCRHNIVVIVLLIQSKKSFKPQHR